MQYLPLATLGAVEGPSGVVSFGIILPGISADYAVSVSITQVQDQYLQGMPPHIIPLTHAVDQCMATAGPAASTSSPARSRPLLLQRHLRLPLCGDHALRPGDRLHHRPLRP